MERIAPNNQLPTEEFVLIMVNVGNHSICYDRPTPSKNLYRKLRDVLLTKHHRAVAIFHIKPKQITH